MDMIISQEKPKGFVSKDFVSCIYVVVDDHILLLQYSEKGPKNKDLSNKWGIISGKNEDGEDCLDCAVRETFEETGLIVKKEDLVGIGHYYYIGNDSREVFDYVLRLDSRPEVVLSKEHLNYSWVHYKDMETYDLVRGRRGIIECSKLKWLN